MNAPCPLCKRPLRVWYRLSDMVVVSRCQNPACVMHKQDVEAIGDRIQESVDLFNGLCLKHESRTNNKR